MNIMGSSIQDYLKKINSRLSFFDCISFLVVTIFLGSFSLFLYKEKEKDSIPLIYITNNKEDFSESRDITYSRPFGSISGLTYTFSWCQGAGRISLKNKIYFSTKEEAEAKGRKLSKLCKK